MNVLAAALAALLGGSFAGGALCAWASCSFAAQDAACAPGASETMPHSARIMAAGACGTIPFMAAIALMPDPAACGAAQALAEAVRLSAAAGAAAAGAAAAFSSSRAMMRILSR